MSAPAAPMAVGNNPPPDRSAPTRRGTELTMLAFAFRDEGEIEVPAEQIAGFEQTNRAEIAV